mgnify:CR=1 FL=1
MKKTLFLVLTMASTQAMAAGSSSVGFLSNYVFRGAEIDRSVAYASTEYMKSGFYAGAWAGDTATSEVDFYLGFVADLTKNVKLGLSATAYEYLDDSAGDDRQTEYTYYAKFGFLSLNYADGYDRSDFLAGDRAKIDYDFYSVSLGDDSQGLTLGSTEFEKKSGFDQSGDKTSYIEYHLQGEFEGLDTGLLIGYSEKTEATTDEKAKSTYISIKVSKRFDF